MKVADLDPIDGQLAKVYSETLLSNPFRLLRLQSGQTQKYIADYMEVTTQYIYKHERGLINTPSWQLAHCLIELSGAESTEYEVLDDFYVWVQDMRSVVRSCIKDGGESLLNGPLYNVVTFETFMFNFNAVVAAKLRETSDARSRQMFYRLLCVHPRAVQLFTAKPRSSGQSGYSPMPETLKDALLQTGISYKVVAALELL